MKVLTRIWGDGRTLIRACMPFAMMVVAPTEAVAQQSVFWKRLTDERVRVLCGSSGLTPTPVQGRVLAVREDSLDVLISESAATVVVVLPCITRFEVMRGTRNHRGLGAAVGAGVLGVAFPLLARKGSCRDQVWECTLYAFLGGVLAGASVGNIVGSFVHTPNWKEISLATVQEQPPPLEPGQRVRVTAPEFVACPPVGECFPIEGIFARLDSDSLLLTDIALPLASVVRLEVQRQKSFGVVKGALVGLGLGAATGAFVAFGREVLAFADQFGEEGPYRNPCRETDGVSGRIGCLPLYAAVGAGVGAVWGAIGGRIKYAHWEDVSFERLRVSVVPQRGGRFGLGLSVTF